MVLGLRFGAGAATSGAGAGAPVAPALATDVEENAEGCLHSCFVGPVGAVTVSVAAILSADAASVCDALEVVLVTSGALTVLLVRPVRAVGPSVATPSARDAAARPRAFTRHLIRRATTFC